MHRPTDDLRIRAVKPLISPAELMRELPLTDQAAELILKTRESISAIVRGEDNRLIVVAGPCSIHDPLAAVDYAERLAELAKRYEDELLIVMRVYFEKPRTVVGWKGLINDPDLDGTYQINKGLQIARTLMMEIAKRNLPAGTEFLDTTVPQYIADLVSWGAIGARTTESQVHRELASGLSMPVGFKNATDGDPKTAIDAVLAARSSHWFPSVTKEGVAAVSQTTGNDTCHIILRGGTKTGPNYSVEHVEKAAKKLAKAGLPSLVMIDCSHGNSEKDHLKQMCVAEDICNQVRSGSFHVMGVMLESNIVEGRQDYSHGTATYGQSVTDACISIEQTVPILENLAESVRMRARP